MKITITAIAGLAAAVLTPSAFAQQMVGPFVPGDTTDEWRAPDSYYLPVEGEGQVLKDSLEFAMSVDFDPNLSIQNQPRHIQRAYGDFRFSSRLHDADPDRPGRILLAYNRASVSGTWDSGSTWNREHVWPQSLQSGSASNSTRGHLGDPHALRPLNPSINSSRGNKPFGRVNTTGGFGAVSGTTFYFPGDADKGDIARALFYSATRYEAQGLTLVNLPNSNSSPGFNQMGDLTSLIAWHYLDIPDEFERRRNHVIYSQALNPSYYTRNRNAYVDLPGAAWSVFMDDMNDSQLWIGDNAAADGSSQLNLSVRAIEGEAAAAFEFMLNRAGADGVYYAVSASGDAITDQSLHNGFTAAFPIGDSTPRPIRIGLDPLAIQNPGLYSGAVTIDNLDMTTGLGSGFGALDADDVINFSQEVLAPSAASLDEASQIGSVMIDAGVLPLNQESLIDFPLYALETAAGFTAGAAFQTSSIMADQGTAMISLPEGAVEAGGSALAMVQFTPDQAGAFTVSVEIAAADDPSVLGAGPRSTMSVEITGTAGIPVDFDGNGVVNISDLFAFIGAFTMTPPDPATDFDGNGVVNISDLFAFIAAFTASP
ncbi:MAG: endonuclease [Planctomycetota bacterium]